MTPRKIGIIVFLVLLVGGGAGSILYTMWRLQGHSEYLTDKGPRAPKTEKADGQNITLTETQNGVRKWELNVSKIHYNKDSSVGELTGVSGQVFGQEQKVLFTFSAPKGTFYKANSRIDLTDGASMKAPASNIEMHAPKMSWSAQSNDVVAEGGVKMAKKGLGSTYADSAKFAMDFSQIAFHGHTRSEFEGL